MTKSVNCENFPKSKIRDHFGLHFLKMEEMDLAARTPSASLYGRSSPTTALDEESATDGDWV